MNYSFRKKVIKTQNLTLFDGNDNIINLPTNVKNTEESVKIESPDISEKIRLNYLFRLKSLPMQTENLLNVEPDTNETEKFLNVEPDTNETENLLNVETDILEKENLLNVEPDTNETEKPLNVEPVVSKTEKPLNVEPVVSKTEKPLNVEPVVSKTEKPLNVETDTNETEKPLNVETDTNETEDLLNVEPVISEKIYSLVPLNIFQTWYTLNLPTHMKETVELLKIQNPEFKHFLYDDKMCREFIKQYFEEDVLYTFDKLKPGAYKSDLWRYCILYIHGGIYLDIKYYCVNNFKLIKLTDKEYLVKDRPQIMTNSGIYQAFMAVYPKNNILRSLINDIVYNCKHNNYKCGIIATPLDITGPGLLANYFKTSIIDSFELENIGDIITYNKNTILVQYEKYRTEQITHAKTKYYDAMFRNSDVYQYITLHATNTHMHNMNTTKNILGEMVKFYSGTPTIVEMNDSYLVNIRWNNSNYNEDGSPNVNHEKWISLNSRFTIDSNFNKISDEIFLEEDFNIDTPRIGLEDIKIFLHNDKYYYLATCVDVNRRIKSISSDIYNISKTYELNRNIILPTMYNLSDMRQEENWSFVNYKNELSIIYKWFPLQIGKINYTTNVLDIIEIKPLPEYFKEAQGSTCGYTKNNEIWFVLHKVQYSEYGKYNYQHFFAIFDLDMNVLRYSELFKFGDCKVEFCNGLIVKDEFIILSYSLMDTHSMISEYHINDINSIKWYKIESE